MVSIKPMLGREVSCAYELLSLVLDLPAVHKICFSTYINSLSAWQVLSLWSSNIDVKHAVLLKLNYSHYYKLLGEFRQYHIYKRHLLKYRITKKQMSHQLFSPIQIWFQLSKKESNDNDNLKQILLNIW